MMALKGVNVGVPAYIDIVVTHYPVLMACQNFSLLMILGINREKTKSPREKNTFQVRRLAPWPVAQTSLTARKMVTCQRCGPGSLSFWTPVPATPSAGR